MTGARDRQSLLERACAVDRRIRALDQAVTGLCAAAELADGPACAACVWERVVKPLALPLVGWERGLPPLAVKDPRPPGAPLHVMGIGALLEEMDEQKSRRTPASSETERWLRSQEAWDAVTGAWLARLHEADPAAGHGIGWAERPSAGGAA